jgi:hypothetical protein
MNFTLTAIDVAIGLIFVYLLMALICSVLQEFIANLTSWRGRHLRNSIQSMLNDPSLTGLAHRLYRHPRIATLTFPGKLPSYIPSKAFAAALVDIVSEDNNLRAVPDGPLAPFLREAAGEAEKLKVELANWFDDSMDCFGGWYKRNVQLVLFALALLLAALLNVNSLEIARVLWTQPVLRDAIVQSADKFSRQDDSAKDQPLVRPIADLQQQLDGLHLPIGWEMNQLECLFGVTSRFTAAIAPQPPAPTVSSLCQTPQGQSGNQTWQWLVLIAGWLVTALAASFGSQFWFQALGNALKLRAAGEKPPKASADDSQTGTGG